MPLYIGRNAAKEVEIRNYKEGATPAPGFRTPAQLVERVEELESTLRAMKLAKGSRMSEPNSLDSLFKGFGGKGLFG